MFKVTTSIELSNQRIADVLTGAFEGGSTYWIQSVTPRFKTHSEYSEPASYEPENFVDRLIIAEDEEDSFHFTLTTIDEGLQIMADKYSRHMADLINENDDADTSDVLLQCILFGDIVYG